jgi:pyruvate/2-oxoglutarate dehydrogenase complex dihydrolipoamide acyltransferase (E2) component
MGYLAHRADAANLAEAPPLKFIWRKLYNLTVSFDHDIVDGAPATRFVHRLVELIESGCGLDEMDGLKCSEGVT